ncbi:MAG: c-type cytochrome [Cytophagales bacterium]|nr:c-type cytochrome [Cytophagales bacterium]
MRANPPDIGPIARLVNPLIGLCVLVLGLIGLTAWTLAVAPSGELIPSATLQPVIVPSGEWRAPDFSTIPVDLSGDEIRYGRELIAHTSVYLGPHGKVEALSNGMNCQNCHLDAGTRPFGNNFSAVASTYPKFRARSGKVETMEERVNNCFERSLNGKPLPPGGREMKAIVAYMKWIGKEVPAGKTPVGAGITELQYLDNPADPGKGKALYDTKCFTCHGKKGEGELAAGGNEWKYPPLWGAGSYTQGAGLFRLSRFAGYVKGGMPFGATSTKPQLTDEEAWHLAAYVNSMHRPSLDISHDWPDISQKPMDHPFGPFADGFDEKQHKYGPFRPIQDFAGKRSGQKKL